MYTYSHTSYKIFLFICMYLFNINYFLKWRCEDFIQFCEIHQHPRHCCGQFFNTKPLFTNLGTCFSTNIHVWELHPFSFSNIKVWLDVRTSKSPGEFCVNLNLCNVYTYQQIIFTGFDFMHKGSDIVGKSSAYFVMNGDDHPVSQLMKSPIQLHKSTSIDIGLTISEVRTKSILMIY